MLATDMKSGQARLWNSLSTAVGLAGFVATALALVAVKLSCIGAVRETALGQGQLRDESGPLHLLSWFAEDLLVAGGVGCLFALLMLATWDRPRARKVAFVAHLIVMLFLALGLFVATEVYHLFGTFPTWQLTAALSDPSNASDSVVDMFDIRSGVFLMALIALTCGGFAVVRRLLRQRPIIARRLAIAAASMLSLTLVAKLVATPSVFGLDENPINRFVGSMLWPPSFPIAQDAGGDFAEVLEPILGTHRPVDPKPYLELKRWASSRPNVVFVVLETTATGHLGLTGGPVPNTPNLSRLASEGLFWVNHYAHSPSSMMALYQLLCGNHSQPQDKHISATRPRIDCHSLSEILVERGYSAGLFHSGRFSYSEKDRFFTGRGYEVLYDAISMPNAQQYKKWSWGIEEQATIDALVGWMKASSSPAFATYIPVYPHHPYPVPSKEYKKFKGGGTEGNYRNAMYYMDQMVGYLLKELDANELLENTLLVFVGDHGEGFGEHPGSKMHGRTLYDEASKTFALWFAPEAMSRGYIDRRVFGHVDVLPTLLDILSLPQEDKHPGVSAYGADQRPMVALYTGYGHPFVGFVDWPFKFIWNRRKRHAELYNLQDDPKEQHSLLELYSEEVQEYTARADALVAAITTWQSALPDLVTEKRGLPPGEDITWRVNPATCNFPETHFAVEQDLLHMTRAGEMSVICEHPLPPGAGRVTGLSVLGNEAVPVAFINSIVSWQKPNGAQELLMYCKLNGNANRAKKECHGVLIPEQTQLGGNGKLRVELRYVTTVSDPILESFMVREVLIRYRVFAPTEEPPPHSDRHRPTVSPGRSH